MVLFASISLASLLVAMIGYLVWDGVGVWGLNNPVGWGFAIVNFVFWVGIGHAGTLISAILIFLDKNGELQLIDVAEAMTIFAVICVVYFPGIHVGRVLFYYLLETIAIETPFLPNFKVPYYGMFLLVNDN